MLFLNSLLEESWRNQCFEYFKTSNWKNLNEKVEQAYAQPFCFPEKDNLFRAFNLTTFHEVRVVILGQDPYHGIGEANGLAFSVNEGVKVPPSLRNIFKELFNDIGIERQKTDLSDWAKQGVLLLNTTLSVNKDQPLSHNGWGWERFTDYIIQRIAQKESPIVFVLWGKHAQKKKLLIPQKRHLIIESAHPSPLGAYRGFFGSKPFSKINDFLDQPIQWGKG